MVGDCLSAATNAVEFVVGQFRRRAVRDRLSRSGTSAPASQVSGHWCRCVSGIRRTPHAPN